jgi:hypothetical protein
MGKKSYKKPEIKKIELRPEEAALTACKVHSGAGPAGPCLHSTCKQSAKS